MARITIDDLPAAEELVGRPEGARPAIWGQLHVTRKAGAAVMHVPKVQDLERAHGVSWAELAGLEPRLEEVLWQARAAGTGCHGWEDVPRVFGPFREAVAQLVGFMGRHSSHPVLGSVGAYEVAYWRLHDAVSGLLPRPRAADVREADQAKEEVRAPRRRAHAGRR